MASFIQRLLASDTLAVKESTDSWESAIRFGGAMMTEKGLCTQDYIEAIIENHKTLGPYFVIAPGIAMPHAKPENGVLQTGYALITLATPVEFGDDENDPVEILIFAGAINREEHNLEVVPQIAELCDSETHIEAIRKATTKEQLIQELLVFEQAFLSGDL